MASTPPKPSKQLGELLQENQEPFTLELYLSERGCLKKPASCCLNKNRRGFPRCSKTLRAVYKKFVSIKEGQRVKSSENRNEEVEESDRFSSASSTTVFNSCSESDKEEISSFDAETVQALKLCNIREKEAATGRKLRRRSMEDSKQLSPVSVLEEIPSHEVQQNARIRQKESHTGVAELQGLGESHPSPQFLKSKRVLQQTKQLLFDCVREVVGSHVKNERGKQHEKKFLGPEELGKLVCERITSWGKQAGDETNTNYFLDSVEEWRAFKEQKREIEYEIGDTILEEIKNEIVTEMFDDFLAPTRC